MSEEIPIKAHVAKPEHEIIYQDIIKLIRRHEAECTQLDMLAIAANLVGKLVAMQDQRRWTADEIMAVVASNIELGNQQMLAMVMQTKGSA